MEIEVGDHETLKIGQFPHEYNLNMRLSFLTFLLKISQPRFELTRLQLLKLGTLFFKEANYFKLETTIFFENFFQRKKTSNKPFGLIFSSQNMALFFTEILCNENLLKPSQFTHRILDNFFIAFQKVNYSNNKL